MKWLAGVLLVAAAVAALWWRWSTRSRGEIGRQEVASRAPGEDGGVPGSAVASPPRVIRLRGGVDERARIAERIAAAQRARRAAPARNPAGDASESNSGAPPPALPAGSGEMDSPEQVLAQMQDALKQVKDHVAECVAQAGTKIDGFKADLSLTGDPDIGTLIDASALSSVDGTALPPQFDDCVRGVMQSLQLPAMNVGDAFKVNYIFEF